MNVGNLTWGHLGKRATIRSVEGGTLSGELTSMEYSWGELFMGKMVMKGDSAEDGLRLTIGGWPAVASLDTPIEVTE